MLRRVITLYRSFCLRSLELQTLGSGQPWVGGVPEELKLREVG